MSTFSKSLEETRRRGENPNGIGIQETRELCRLITDSLPELVWVESANTEKVIYANEAFYVYFGDDIAGRGGSLARCHRDDEELVQDALRVGRAGGNTCEARLRSGDGRDLWHQLTFKPLVTDGELVGRLVSALDIESMIRNRRELEEMSALLRLSQEAAGAGLFDVRFESQEMVLAPVSAGLHGLAGDRPAIIDIKDWMRRIHPADRAPTLRTVRAAVERASTFDVEFRVRLANGDLRWLQAIGRPCHDESGAPRNITGLNLDISARKEAETALVEAKREAEAARLSAERANAAKTEFLSAMSHELRTPLNAVIGFAGLLAGSERLDGDLQRYANLVRASGANLLGIVNDILDLASVEAGTITLDLKPFALQPLVDGCLTIVGASASDKRLDVVTLIDSSIPVHLVGDESRLQQVLLNLLNNAVKFTPRGSITLSLRHEGRTPWGERIHVSVADTGIGIPDDHQQRLFERFYQVDNSIRRDVGGTGLGLAISKRLVERMGGEIGVNSVAGHGSTFWFRLTLPRADAPAETAAHPACVAPARPAKILLVEDIDINRELAGVMLRAAGHTVDIAENGFAAVRAVEASAYDIVLMDIQMPGMDGLMATRLIRCLPGAGARVPIIAMTANVLPAQVTAFREAGLDDHLGKPFSRADLHAMVARWLPDAPPRPVPEPSPAAAPALTIDRESYEANLGLLPPQSVVRLLTHLGKLLTQSFLASPETRQMREDLRREAHALAAAAGLIGFSRLSTACAALDGYGERRIADEGRAGFDAALARIRTLCAAASFETRRLIADLEAPSAGLGAGR
ncbi:ATP-binding protein [Methylobacterium sp. J-068]|uniref:hybrid sensor histidine kinase/response regulator n=1 Tax=Methylobacterium sp. J-068 TaxID=2836649 RepID=UPI001FB9B15B|nr:ATP-binding protein [Methylobacterium sp. J-068]MCJ2035451.1 ATP-binding protein [Methylobacterium sp. J-068]